MHQTGRRRDLEIFEAGAPNWWDPAGPMAGLHLLNPVRSAYFRERLERAGVRCVLELGCGGGILTSSLEDGPWTLCAQDLCRDRSSPRSPTSGGPASCVVMRRASRFAPTRSTR